VKFNSLQTLGTQAFQSIFIDYQKHHTCKDQLNCLVQDLNPQRKFHNLFQLKI